MNDVDSDPSRGAADENPCQEEEAALNEFRWMCRRWVPSWEGWGELDREPRRLGPPSLPKLSAAEARGEVAPGQLLPSTEDLALLGQVEVLQLAFALRSWVEESYPVIYAKRRRQLIRSMRSLSSLTASLLDEAEELGAAPWNLGLLVRDLSAAKAGLGQLLLAVPWVVDTGKPLRPDSTKLFPRKAVAVLLDRFGAIREVVAAYWRLVGLEGDDDGVEDRVQNDVDEPAAIAAVRAFLETSDLSRGSLGLRALLDQALPTPEIAPQYELGLRLTIDRVIRRAATVSPVAGSSLDLEILPAGLWKPLTRALEELNHEIHDPLSLVLSRQTAREDTRPPTYERLLSRRAAALLDSQLDGAAAELGIFSAPLSALTGARAGGGGERMLAALEILGAEFGAALPLAHLVSLIPLAARTPLKEHK